MSKTVRVLLGVILVLVMLMAAVVLVPKYAWGIDIFDLSGWKATDEGIVQYLDRRGDPLTGWQSIEGNWYYFAPENGGMTTGWLEEGGSRYYLGDDGVRKTGWLELSDGVYYVDPQSGAAASGWTELDGSTYYLTETGKKCTGITEVDGNTYLLDDDGKRLSGWTVYHDGRYFLSEEGIITTGWAETDLGRCWFGEDGILGSGWTDTDEGRYFLTENGTIATGWLDTEEGRLYLDENGQPGSGWTDTDEGRFYLGESGIVHTGWLELDGKRYYLHENGVMAIGKVIIEEQNFYFASNGEHVYLVNSWNPVPEGYEVEMEYYSGQRISLEAYDNLVAMIGKIKAMGYYKITSMYRSVSQQQGIWDTRYQRYINSGYSHEGALAEVAKQVAIPGTSEHHLGLAVDISATDAIHEWLAQHSWEYGFILRYPEGKTHITGIIHEPWHFRYLGKDLAEEVFNTGLTLEEYMDMLTQQAGNGTGTASNPELYG